MGIEAHDVAADFVLSDSIGFHVAEPLRQESHQLLVAGAELLSLAVVRIAGGGVARKEFFDRFNFGRGSVRRADQTGKLGSAWRGALSGVRNGKELERAVGLARINESGARPLELSL